MEVASILLHLNKLCLPSDRLQDKTRPRFYVQMLQKSLPPAALTLSLFDPMHFLLSFVCNPAIRYSATESLVPNRKN